MKTKGNMSKTIYLLGAGASYGIRNDESLIIEGLPVMDELKRELNEFRTWFGNIEDIEKPIIILEKKRPFKEVKQYIVNAIDKFIEGLEDKETHPTIDSLAKDLYDHYDYMSEIKISCGNLYGYLKFLMASFFLYEQHIHPHDTRYDTFLNSILTPEGTIPDNMFFLTWNYDMQLEMAYYLKTGKQLPVCIPVEKEGYAKEAKVFKINGSANYFNINHMDCLVLKNEKELIERMFHQYAITHSEDGRFFSSGTTDLYFAWEKEVFDQKSQFLKRNTKDAEILVVIGYSFPDVNAIIDKEILDSMPNLQRIYVQDKNPQNVIPQMKLLLNERLRNCIEPIFDVTKYFIPKS